MKKNINAATHAHTNLNTFHSIVVILEGGTLYGDESKSGNKTANKIIELCKAEQQRQLKIYDEAIKAANGIKDSP